MADEYLTAALYGMKRFNEWSSKKVKEIIGVEKLIELLNEFETPQSGVVFKSYDDYDGTFYGVDCDGETEISWSDSLICSKKYGFIKWLVENDKLKWTNKMEMRKIMLGMPEKQDYYIMMLAVTPQPIEFLISILK